MAAPGSTVGGRGGAEQPIVDAWPQELYRTSMPIGTVFTDLGVSGSTMSAAIDEQLALALELQPTVVTVG